MKIIGFNFSKLVAERKKQSVENLKINTEMDISSIKSLKTDLFKGKEEILEVLFKYNVDYASDMAKISLEGSMILSVDPKKSKQILKEWKKKKIEESVKISLYNIILKKSTLKALELEEELNLPYHIPMPSFKKQSS